MKPSPSAKDPSSERGSERLMVIRPETAIDEATLDHRARYGVAS